METQLFQACTDGVLSTVEDLITKHRLNPNEVKESSGLTPLHLACKHGHLDITQYLIREQNCNPNSTTTNGHTPLHLACKGGHLRIVKCLITEYKCNPHCTDNDGCTPLHAASESGDLDSVKYLITENGCDPQVSDSVGNTPLHYASKSGHMNIVQCLISDFHCDPQKPNGRGSIPLHYACCGDALPVAKYFVTEHKCSPDHTNIYGNTLIHLACLYGHLATVKYLTNECKCNPQIASSVGVTPLHFACLNGHHDIVKFLLSQCNCNPHCSDNSGNTPLHYACQNGHLEVAQYLNREHKCNPEHCNLKGFTPLHSAAINGHQAVLKYFITELGCDPQIGDNYGLTALHYASLNGHNDIINFLMSDCNCDPQCCTNKGYTPLHFACVKGHLQITKYLVNECKSSPEHGNVSGSTPLHSAASNGHLAVVKFLISELGCDPQIGDNDGLTPLHYATLNGHHDLVDFLLSDCKCDPNIPTIKGNTPLHYACQNGHLEVTQYLIREHKCNPERCNLKGFTPLHSAASNGHLAVVKYCIGELGCFPQIGDNDGVTPLHFATLNGHYDIVKFLLSDCNCNPQYSTNRGFTPLDFACQNGHLEITKYLVNECKCSPEHGNVDGSTPPISAAKNGLLAVLKYLISQCGSNAQIDDNDGLRPLHYATLYGHHDIVKFLLSDCKCDPNICTIKGNTPLHCACQNGHLKVAQYLIKEHKCNPEHGNTDSYTPLHSAANNGHLAVVKYFVTELGCDPQIGDNDGVTPLHYATLNGHYDLVNFLLSDCKCNPNIPTIKGNTPLHYACQNGRLEDTQYLIKEHKCNPEHRNVNGYTPLHSAASNGHLAVVKYFIVELGCNPQIGDNNGLTPLHYATFKGNHDIVNFLISNCNCDPQCSTNRGFTPLHCACEEGHLEITKYLVNECKSSPEHGNVSGSTPMHSAASNGHLAVVKYLICELGCNPQIVDNDGLRPLHYATLHGHHDIVKFLLSVCKCDPNICTIKGNTPLHYACQNGHLKVVQYLIQEHKCNPEHRNVKEFTPLHSAASNGHLALLKYLINDVRCNPQIGDNDGLTPLHYATLEGHHDVVKFLLSDCKCNPNSRTIKGNTLLHYACQNGHLEIAKYLITEHDCDPEPEIVYQYTPLHSAARKGHLAVVEYLTGELGCNPHIADKQHLTPFHYASANGHLNIMRYLVCEHNCNPQCVDSCGTTPLHLACSSGHLDIVKYLIHEQNCACDPECGFHNNEISTTLNIFGFSKAMDFIHLIGTEGFTPLHFACTIGNTDIAKYLINDCNCNPFHPNSGGITPFDCAQMLGHVEIVTCVSSIPESGSIRTNATVKSSDDSCAHIKSFTPLHLACFVGNLEAVKMCINQFDNIPSPTCTSNITPLHIACFMGHLEVAKYLVTECGCDPKCVDDDGYTPLHYACRNGHLEIAKYLITEHDCNPEPEIAYQYTPLHSAARNGHLAVVEYLIGKLGCNPHIADKQHLTPLHYASANGHLNIMKYLISEHNCNPQCVDSCGTTPLHYASTNGHLHVVKYFIGKLNCNPQCVDNCGTTPLHLACSSGHLDIVKYLIYEQNCACDPECGFHNNVISTTLNKFGTVPLMDFIRLIGTEGFTPLHFACMKGNTDIAKYLINNCNCNPFHPNSGGFTPFDYAQMLGHVEIVTFVSSIPGSGSIRTNATVQSSDDSCAHIKSFTPLHLACHMGNLEALTMCINQFHNNPSSTCTSDITPLHIVCFMGCLEVVKYLVTECGCDPKCVNCDGLTPLHCACMNGHLEVAKYLVTEHDCNPEPEIVFQHTPLHAAAGNGHLAVVEYLISELGCNPRIADNDGLTPLHYATLEGHHDVVKFLISDCKCNPNSCTIKGNTLLHYACRNGHLEIAKYLITEHDCNPEPEIVFQCTPLHSAARNGHLAVVEYLIGQLGCNPHISDKQHLTPLHHACLGGHLSTMKFLISECNCNVECTDRYGATPLHLACMNGHLELVQYLCTEYKINPEHSSEHCDIPQIGNSNGCNPQCVDNSYCGTTPLHLACFNGHLDVVNYLIHEQKCPCDPKCSFNEELLKNTLHSNEFQAVPLMDIAYLIIGNEGLTPLHFACMKGNTDIVKYLINNCNCNLFDTTSGGFTPIDFAHMFGHLEIVKLVQVLNIPGSGMDRVVNTVMQRMMGSVDDTGANINPTLTPLHWACYTGNLEAVKLYIKRFNIPSSSTWVLDITPLQIACQMGNLEIVKYLVTACECNPNFAAQHGLTSLHHACTMGQLEVVKYLVTQCACNPMTLDDSSRTPLHYACTMGHLEVIKYLITQCQCDPMFTNDGITLLHCACSRGHLEVVKYLVTQCKCDPRCIIGNGSTPLHPGKFTEEYVKHLNEVPRTGYFDVHLYPLSVKGFLSRVSAMHLTPLHVACTGGHLEIVKYLITEYDCNPNSCDSLITPLGCALIGKHLEILHYLMTECRCNIVCHLKLFCDVLKQQCEELDQILISMEILGLNDMNISPLYFASALGDLETVKVICNYSPREETVAPLTAACKRGDYDIVRFLLTVYEYSDSDISMALVAASIRGQIGIIKYLLPQCSENLSYLLFVSCLYGQLDVVRFLIDECGCDPHYTSEDGLTSLHGTCTDVKCVLHEFVEDGNLSLEGSTKKQGVLFYILQTVSYPIMLMLQLMTTLKSAATVPGVSYPDDTLEIDNDRRSHLELKSAKFDIFKYLIVEQKCVTQCKDKDGRTPLHYACASGQLDIVQYIYTKKLSDLVHTTQSGDTPLHMACKFSQVEITEFLLKTGECKALCENAEGLTPLEISTSIEIRKLLEIFCKGNYPLESIVKVYIVGAPLAGKSSLVQALKSNHDFASSLIGRFQRVKGVRQQTAGIDSLSFCSKDFGNVVMFDFAGQQEFYTSHAAFLQNSSPDMAGIFILVVNIDQCEDDISKNLQYWVSFIQDCCAHNETRPCVIFVGSHADQLASGDVDQAFVLLNTFSQHSDNVNNFYTLEGIVCLDCTRPASNELGLLCSYLEESCNSIRESTGSIDQRCYILHRYIRKTYINTGVQGCTLENISKDLENNPYLLPSTSTELQPLFQTLHKKSQILLLENHKNVGESWVIINIPALLETVVGSIFAPRDFPQHISPGSTGVVAKSRLCEAFPDLNIDMVVGFLEHFEFCHHLESDWIKLSVLAEVPKEVTDDEYYLFPALVTSNHLSRDSYESSYCCGWFIQQQFFTAQFLHVLLLRLAFNFALPQDSAIPGNTKVETPGLKRSCTMCKNGITWSDGNGVSTLLEVKDLKTVILVMSSMKGRETHCVRLRMQLIKTIFKAKSDFCPRALIDEFIMEVESGRELQAVEECPSNSISYSIQYLSGRIAARGTQDPPDMYLVNQDGSRGKQISQLLFFEPYSLLTSELISELFSEENADRLVPDTFTSQLADCLYPCNNILVQILLSQPVLLREKLIDEMDTDALASPTESSLLLRCVHILKAWVEQQGPDATYRKLRQKLNDYSIFSDRNPLTLLIESGKECEDDHEEDSSIPDRPTFTKCIRFRAKDRRINIPQEIGLQYHQFGLFLLKDDTMARVNSIAHKHKNDVEHINGEIIQQWIAGRGKQPITWKTLTEVLYDSELSSLAGEIEAVKCQHNSERGVAGVLLDGGFELDKSEVVELQDKVHFSEAHIDQLTLIECVRFRGRERRINISQEIGTKYVKFGVILLEERTVERVSAIAQKHMGDPEQTSMEILREWIAGRGKHPITWKTLIEVLHDIELSTLAREIEAVKFPEGDEVHRPTDVTEDSSQKTTSNVCTSVITEDSDHRRITDGSIQDFRRENSEGEVNIVEEEVNITEDLLAEYFEAMLLECGDSDTHREGSDQEPAQDTEANILELQLDAVLSELLNAFGYAEPEQEDQASNGSPKKDNSNKSFEAMLECGDSDTHREGSDREPAQDTEPNILELQLDAVVNELLNAIGYSEPEQEDQASNGSPKKDNSNVLIEEEGLD